MTRAITNRRIETMKSFSLNTLLRGIIDAKKIRKFKLRGLITLGCSYPIPPLPCNAVKPLARLVGLGGVGAGGEGLKSTLCRVKFAQKVLRLRQHTKRLVGQLAGARARIGLLHVGQRLGPLRLAPQTPPDQIRRQRILRILLVPAHRKIQRDRRGMLAKEIIKGLASPLRVGPRERGDLRLQKPAHPGRNPEFKALLIRFAGVAKPGLRRPVASLRL